MWSSVALLLLVASAGGQTEETSDQAGGERLRFPRPMPKVDPRTVPADYSIAGRWYSAFGYLDLEQEGRAFTGTYSCCGGTIEGTIGDTQIDFSWKDPIYGEGWGYFRAPQDGTKLLGAWGEKGDFGSSGTWNAVRHEEAMIKGEASRFRVETEHPQFGLFQGTAVIGIEGTVVTGKIEGVFETEVRDRVYREEVHFLLEGRTEAGRLILEWEDPRNAELGGLELEGDDSKWVGEWEAHRTAIRVPMVWAREIERVDEKLGGSAH
jgi:hypothetical protein